MSRSAWTTLAMSGRRIFRATVRPSRSTARCTCEIDAEATGLGLQRQEDLARRPAILFGEYRFDLAKGKGPHIIAKGGKLDRVRFGQDVGSCGKHLAELDERRPEVFADHPQPAGPVVQRGLDPHRHPFDGTNDPFEVKGADDVVVAVADEGRQDLPVAGKVAEMADGFTKQGITAFTREVCDTRQGSDGSARAGQTRSDSRPRMAQQAVARPATDAATPGTAR